MRHDDFTAIPPSNFEMRRLFAADDELGVILKGHLYVEHHLGLLLARATAQTPDQVFRRSFREKIKDGGSAGVIPSDEVALYKLTNDIRNRFAHQPRSCFSEPEPQ